MKLENKWFDMRKAEGKNGTPIAEIFIYDEIGGWGISANEFINSLKSLGQVDEIHLRINSPGGSIIEGNTIFNAIKRHDARVVVHIDGLSASMGSVIAMAGDEIYMANNALLMIHNPWTFSMGEADDLRKDADLLDKMKETILNAYSRSSYSREELTDLMNKETWFTAQEALNAGFIDAIENALEMVASLDETRELAKSKDLSIPTDKVLAVMREKHKEEVDSLNAELSSANDQLAQNAIKIADYEAKVIEVDALQDKVDDLKDEIVNIIENHKIEVAKAKKITEKAIADRASEIVGLQTLETVHNNDAVQNDAKVDEHTFWAEYHSLPIGDRNSWYAENKHRIE